MIGEGVGFQKFKMAKRRCLLWLGVPIARKIDQLLGKLIREPAAIVCLKTNIRIGAVVPSKVP